MKLQNLAIIFLVIAIPLIIILSYYLDLQQDTLKLQAEYDSKLSEAAKEGIKAFEINTVDWSSRKENDRKNTTAMINAFITSLSNNLNISGTAKEYMANYIPAIAVTMYDGYYIYAPAYVPITIENNDGVQLYDDGTGTLTATTEESENSLILYKAKAGSGQNYEDEEGNLIIGVTTDVNQAEREYKHTLNNKIQYSAKYRQEAKDLDVVVNYTLDNRIYIYGTKGSEYIEKDGYLVYFDNDTLLPKITITGNTSEEDIEVERSIINTVCSKKITSDKIHKLEIDTETLTEQIVYKSDEYVEHYELGTFKYVYDVENEKLYYDDDKQNFFTLKSDKTRAYISNTSDIKVGSSECKYKSVSVLVENANTIEYTKIYQVLNGRDKGKWYINLKADDTEEMQEIDTEITGNNLILLGLDNADFAAIYKDYSAISYYVEAYAFTNWVKQNLGGQITCETTNETITGLFEISSTNDLEEEYSTISEHKKEIMKNSINQNLNLSISNYNRNGAYDFKLPMLTETDWENVFRNISMIAFFQGVPIGLKYYNNYTIATSTTNREYVDPGEIYFSGEDNNYHRVYCAECSNKVYTGYRSVEYTLKEYTNNGITTYYYEHDNQSNEFSETACYYCVVNKANYKIISDDTSGEKTYKQAKAYHEALARERYYQYEKLSGKVGVVIKYHENLAVGGEVNRVNVPAEQEAEIGVTTTISSTIPTVTTNDSNIKYVFVGWAESADSTTIRYMPGDTDVFYEDKELWAIWRISLGDLGWNQDNSPSISTINITENENGDLVEMTGNETLPGKGATWATFESQYVQIQEFQFKYYVNKGDSFNAAGFMFNVVDTGATLEGYMLSINFAGNFYSKAGSNGAIYKFTYTKGANSANVEQIELITALPFGSYTSGRESSGSGTITIKVTDGGYIINGSELSQDYFVPVDRIQPNTFGFLSDHYSHGCDQIGYFKLSDIKVVVVRK